MPKFCPDCGAPLTVGIRFCPSCGASVAPSVPSQQPAQTQQQSQPVQFQQTQQQPVYQQPQQPQPPQFQQPPMYQQQPPRPQTPRPQIYIPEQFAQRNAAKAQQDAAPFRSAPVRSAPVQSAPVQKKKGRGGLAAAVSLVLVAAILVGVFGFREGGWFRGIGKQTVEATALNPELKSEVTVKERKAPDGLDDEDKFESFGKWYDVTSDGYDGLPLSGDVLLTVSLPGKNDREALGAYVFLYYDEDHEEYRYLFPDGYDLSAGTMTIDLPHFSPWGTAKLTKEEQIEAFLDSYSTKLAVERGKRQQAAADLEPYVRKKVEAMGLTRQAAADLIQSTVNFLGSRFTGDNAKYIEMGTKYATTLTRGYYDDDKDAALSGLEDAVTDAVMNCWGELGYTENLNDVLENGFVGDTTEKLLSSTNGIVKMAGYLAGGDTEGAMKELGGVMKGVHPAVELTTNAVAYLGAKVNEEFTNWKSNQIEELYQIYKNGAEDIWGNEVIAGNRESFLTYLNTSSGFTMAKGVTRFYNLDKVGEICEKYGWPYSTYEELPSKYRDVFEKRAENGLMEYFELRLKQEKTAEQIKSSERACIETMMNDSYGALSSTNFGKFFGEETADDYNLTSRLERLVNVRRFVSQYVDEDELAKVSKVDNSYNYGDILNWWVKLASENDKTEAIIKFREELREHGFLKTLGVKAVSGLVYEKTINNDGVSLPVWNKSGYDIFFKMPSTERNDEGKEVTVWKQYNSPRETDASENYRNKASDMIRSAEIAVSKDGKISCNKAGMTVEGDFDPITKTGRGTITINTTYSHDYGKEAEIREMVPGETLPSVMPQSYYDVTMNLTFELEIKPNPDGAGVLFVLNGGGTVSYTGEVLSSISGIKIDEEQKMVLEDEGGLVVTMKPFSGSYAVTYKDVTYLFSMQ